MAMILHDPDAPPEPICRFCWNTWETNHDARNLDAYLSCDCHDEHGGELHPRHGAGRHPEGGACNVRGCPCPAYRFM